MKGGDLHAEREWRIAFMVLASSRARSLWTFSGIPQRIHADPAAAVSAATEFLLSTAKGPSEDEYRRCLERALARIAVEYGDGAVDALVGWAKRHFVRDMPWGPLDAWARFFLTASDARNHLDEFLRIDPARKRVLVDMIRANFYERYRQLRDLEAQAEALPLGAREASVTAFDTGVPEYGIVGTHFPVVATAFQAAIAELAAEIWAKLDEMLEPQERREFMRWAQETASERHIPADQLRDPEPSG